MERHYRLPIHSIKLEERDVPRSSMSWVRRPLHSRIPECRLLAHLNSQPSQCRPAIPYAEPGNHVFDTADCLLADGRIRDAETLKMTQFVKLG